MTTLLTRILSELKIPYTKNFSEDLYKENPSLVSRKNWDEV